MSVFLLNVSLIFCFSECWPVLGSGLSYWKTLQKICLLVSTLILPKDIMESLPTLVFSAGYFTVGKNTVKQGNAVNAEKKMLK